MRKYKILVFIYLVINFCQSCSCQEIITLDKFNSCYISSKQNLQVRIVLSESLHDILKRSSDTCNFRLADSVFAYYLAREDKTSFKMLFSLANNCDGYMTEYFIEKIELVNSVKFKCFFNFLFKDYKKGNNNILADLLVEYWSNKVSISDLPDQTRLLIRSLTTKEVLKSKGNIKDKLRYLENLLSKINPFYLN